METIYEVIYAALRTGEAVSFVRLFTWVRSYPVYADYSERKVMTALKKMIADGEIETAGADEITDSHVYRAKLIKSFDHKGFRFDRFSRSLRVTNLETGASTFVVSHNLGPSRFWEVSHVDPKLTGFNIYKAPIRSVREVMIILRTHQFLPEIMKKLEAMKGHLDTVFDRVLKHPAKVTIDPDFYGDRCPALMTLGYSLGYNQTDHTWLIQRETIFPGNRDEPPSSEFVDVTSFPYNEFVTAQEAFIGHAVGGLFIETIADMIMDEQMRDAEESAATYFAEAGDA